MNPSDHGYGNNFFTSGTIILFVIKLSLCTLSCIIIHSVREINHIIMFKRELLIVLLEM